MSRSSDHTARLSYPTLAVLQQIMVVYSIQLLQESTSIILYCILLCVSDAVRGVAMSCHSRRLFEVLWQGDCI